MSVKFLEAALEATVTSACASSSFAGCSSVGSARSVGSVGSYASMESYSSEADGSDAGGRRSGGGGGGGGGGQQQARLSTLKFARIDAHFGGGSEGGSECSGGEYDELRAAAAARAALRGLADTEVRVRTCDLCVCMCVCVCSRACVFETFVFELPSLRFRVLCIFVLCLTILKKIRHRREGVYWQQRTRAARPIRAPIHECKDVWPPQRLVERSGSLGLRRKLR